MNSIKILFKKVYPTFKLALLEIVNTVSIDFANLKELGMKELFFAVAYPDLSLLKNFPGEQTSWSIDGEITLSEAARKKCTVLVIGK